MGYNIGDKVIFLEDYKYFYFKGDITTINGQSYLNYNKEPVHKIKYRGESLSCYDRRIAKIVDDNHINRLLYPEYTKKGNYLIERKKV